MVGTPPKQWQTARANELTMVIAHGNEHYGNRHLHAYQGYRPPSSAPQ